MKKSITLVAAHIHDEDESVYRSHATSKPKISYSQAMQSFFVIQGAIHQVETCSVWAIQDLVTAAILTARNPAVCKGELNGLDLRDTLDRWWVLQELIRQRAIVPLYSSMVEAEKALAIAQSKSIQPLSKVV